MAEQPRKLKAHPFRHGRCDCLCEWLCNEAGSIPTPAKCFDRVAYFVRVSIVALILCGLIVWTLVIEVPLLGNRVSVVYFDAHGESNPLEFPMISICANGNIAEAALPQPIRCSGPNNYDCLSDIGTFETANPLNLSTTVGCVVVNNATSHSGLAAASRFDRVTLWMNISGSIGASEPFIPAQAVFVVFSPQACNPISCSLRAVVSPNSYNSFGLEKEIEWRYNGTRKDRATVFLFSHSEAPLLVEDPTFDTTHTIILEIYFRTLVVTRIEQEHLITQTQVVSDVGGKLGYFGLFAAILAVAYWILKQLIEKCCCKRLDQCCEDESKSLAYVELTNSPQEFEET